MTLIFQSLLRKCLKSGTFLFLLLIFSGTLLSKTSTKFLWTPDPYCLEINDDSTTVNFGDTIAVIQDGGDTVIILNDQVDSSNSNRLISTSDIIIALTNNQSTIQKGTYGLNIADIFLPGHAPFTDNDEYLTGESPWDYLASLAPNILRYPGGASSKLLIISVLPHHKWFNKISENKRKRKIIKI